MRIGVDLMGSDRSPFNLFEAILEAEQLLDHSVSFVVIATHRVVTTLKQSYPSSQRIHFHPVKEAISMSDEPITAVARKTGSSIVVGIRLLKKQRIDAFISAGNTGALVTSAALQLPRLPGIKRPALLALLPTVSGSVAVLDIGGNVSCKASHLVQFAYMGAVFQSCHSGIESPNVALLNIGVEPKKGTSNVRQAYQILESHPDSSPMKFHFIGNVEGREVFQGGVDVLVTDGFTGNVLLKTSEGVASFIFDFMDETLKGTQSDKLMHSFQQLKSFFSYADQPGAFLCGVEGIVVKCHGSSPPKAFVTAIQQVTHLYNQQLIEKMKQLLQ